LYVAANKFSRLFGSWSLLSWLTCACTCYLQLLSGRFSSDDDFLPVAQFSDQPVTAEETALLNSRLMHSEEMQKDVKEELSEMHHDCIRRQGAEVSYYIYIDIYIHLDSPHR